MVSGIYTYVGGLFATFPSISILRVKIFVKVKKEACHSETSELTHYSTQSKNPEN